MTNKKKSSLVNSIKGTTTYNVAYMYMFWLMKSCTNDLYFMIYVVSK